MWYCKDRELNWNTNYIIISRRDTQKWIIAVAKINEKNGKNYVTKRFTISLTSYKRPVIWSIVSISKYLNVNRSEENEWEQPE